MSKQGDEPVLQHLISSDLLEMARLSTGVAIAKGHTDDGRRVMIIVASGDNVDKLIAAVRHILPGVLE